MKRISFPYLAIIMFAVVGCNYIDVYHDYYKSTDNKNEITFTEYHTLSPSNRGIYLSWGHLSYGIPSDNYIFFKYSDYPLYLRWANDKAMVRFPGGDIIKDKLLSGKIDFKIDFSDFEKKKYHYDDLEQFDKLIKKDYIQLMTRELDKK